MKYLIGFVWGLWLAIMGVGAWVHFVDNGSGAWLVFAIFGSFLAIAITTFEVI